MRGGPVLALVARLTRRLRIRHHQRHGDTFRGNDVLYLTTVGAKYRGPTGFYPSCA
ncbi:hypothetical protein [Dactylosporangium sp. NPDC051541]|uniref:hypothetical protein n=1 Tax=Dactylosporangium sp. NPDC051541 TaxID=3363977 RepID=UPI0037A26B20